MSTAIAKKYVNALIESCDDATLANVYNGLLYMNDAFKIAKFNNIILSPDVSQKNKEALVLSLVDVKEAKFINFIKLLALNDRLALLPIIVKELGYQISLKNNVFEGEVLSDFDISAAQIAMLEANFSKKFNAQVKLRPSKNEYPGIKIALDDLGVEVSFSLERLKAQMSEHILKAI